MKKFFAHLVTMIRIKSRAHSIRVEYKDNPIRRAKSARKVQTQDPPYKWTRTKCDRKQRKELRLR